MQIAQLDHHPEFIETVVDWIVNQWGSSRESVVNSLADNQGCPPALLSMDSTGPTGILSYTFHVLYPQGPNELWINALYVAPQFRRRGIGSRLVCEGLKAAARAKRHSLFVYTDIPMFYEALGWRRFSRDETGMHVLEYGIQPKAAALNLMGVT